VRIELRRATRFTVRVLDADRSPVPGASVELIDCCESGRITAEDTVTDDRRSFTTVGSVMTGYHPTGAFVIFKETTDAEGRARLFGSPLVPRLVLRVRCPGSRPAVVEAFRLPAEDREVEILLTRGAGLDVTVKPASVAQLREAGFALRRSGDHMVLPMAKGYPFGKGGTAQARGIPPGVWEVLLVCSGNRFFDPTLAVVELREGEVSRLELDLPHLAPARLEGRVLWKGEPCRAGRVTLAALVMGQHVSMSADLNASGSFVAEGLLPGRYQVSARFRPPEGEDDVDAAHAEMTELLSGGKLTRVFDLKPRVLRFRVLDHLGRPAAGTKGTLDGDSGSSVGFVTDARGEARVTPIPGAEVTVWIEESEEYTFLERVSVPPDPEPRVTVRMPPPEDR
jgi:hypothetical protein